MESLCAADLMVPNPLTVKPSDKIAMVDLFMVRNHIGGVPVVEHNGQGDKLIGILTHRDIVLSRFSITTGSLMVQDLMSSPAVSCTPDASLKEILRLMLENGVERLPVVDESNYLVGLISHGDILQQVYNRLSDE
jgi:CBS domain-containing protein